MIGICSTHGGDGENDTIILAEQPRQLAAKVQRFLELLCPHQQGMITIQTFLRMNSLSVACLFYFHLKTSPPLL